MSAKVSGVGMGLVAAWYREWRAGHPAGVYWLLLLVAGPVVVWGVSCLMAPKVIIEGGVFAYDLADGKLFAVPSAEIAPFDTPGQQKVMLERGEPMGVRANVFTCGRCKEKDWYIGYLETYLPSGKDAQIRINEEMERVAKMPPPHADGTVPAATHAAYKPDPELVKLVAEGHLVARAEKLDVWYRADSPEGKLIVEDAMKKCADGKYPTQCFPGR